MLGIVQEMSNTEFIFAWFEDSGAHFASCWELLNSTHFVSFFIFFFSEPYDGTASFSQKFYLFVAFGTSVAVETSFWVREEHRRRCFWSSWWFLESYGTWSHFRKLITFNPPTGVSSCDHFVVSFEGSSFYSFWFLLLSVSLASSFSLNRSCFTPF